MEMYRDGVGFRIQLLVIWVACSIQVLFSGFGPSFYHPQTLNPKP